ncbi:MAG: prephenate dehydratase [Gammaproteobacteria bacterium]|nr:prephenate dehydratase [Gammaproteobacteria bacterium]
MSDDEKLKKIRAEIDGIDHEIQRLISARAKCALSVAEVKQAQDGPQAEFYRPEREAQVLRRIMERDSGPLAKDTVAKLFREIMSACLALESPQRVAYLGPEGTFTQEAVLKHFGHAVESHACLSIHAVFREVESGSAKYGVVPVENSTEGVVNHTLDTFMQSPLCIAGEAVIRVHLNLLSAKEALDQVSIVYAHEQALAQSRNWLDAHLPQAKRLAVSSNAEAARIAKQQGEAAIASEMAASVYKLDILSRHIEDQPNNTTRFLVISAQDVPPSGNDKTTLLVSAANKPGALFSLLEPFATRNISMSRIESRPSRGGLWEYVFFIDIDGHKTDLPVADALTTLQSESAAFRILGSYPTAPY